MAWIAKAARSSVGSKVLMSISGLAMVGFLFGHLAGNLLMFGGPEAINTYAESLHSMPLVVWATRLILLVMIVVHIKTAKRLTVINRQAKPQKYAVQHAIKTTLPAKTMFPTGLFLFVYIAYHLAHYTFKITNPEFDKLDHHDVYSMVLLGFQNSWISLFYIVAMLCLGMHLVHGFRSAFQTLGVNHPKYQKIVTLSGPIVAVVVAGGFISIPISIMAGLIR
ncbi:MAG: succinate dehydrogenase cytochrome b subunit [Bdellovibrionota bacterium]